VGFSSRVRALGLLAVVGSLYSPATAAAEAAVDATALLAVEVVETSSATAIEIRTDGKVAALNHFQIDDPKRLIVDFPGLASRLGAHRIGVGNEAVETVRVGLHKEKLRVVIDLGRGAIGADVVPRDRGVLVRIRRAASLEKPTPREATQRLSEPVPSASDAGIRPEPPQPGHRSAVRRWIDEHGITHYTTDPERIPRALREAPPRPATP